MTDESDARDRAIHAAMVLAAQGDLDAAGRLARWTSAPLRRLAMRITGSPDDADDVLQEAYVRAFVALRRGAFDPTRSAMPFLRTLVVRTAFDELRARARRRRLFGAFAEHEAAAAPTRDAAVWRDARRMLERLPEDQRIAFVLKELEGWRASEIALALEVSEGAVEQKLVRARRVLREGTSS